MLDTLKEFLQTQSNNWSLLDHKQELSHLFYISMIAVILHLIDRQVEYILSLNIQWNEQLESDRVESQSVGEVNRLLLENILPPHVLKRYLYNTTVSYDQLYHESVSTSSSRSAELLVVLVLDTWTIASVHHSTWIICLNYFMNDSSIKQSSSHKVSMLNKVWKQITTLDKRCWLNISQNNHYMIIKAVMFYYITVKSCL